MEEIWKETKTDDGKRISGSNLGRIRTWNEKDQDWRIRKLSIDVCNDKYSDLNMKFQGHSYKCTTTIYRYPYSGKSRPRLSAGPHRLSLRI